MNEREEDRALILMAFGYAGRDEFGEWVHQSAMDAFERFQAALEAAEADARQAEERLAQALHDPDEARYMAAHKQGFDDGYAHGKLDAEAGHLSPIEAGIVLSWLGDGPVGGHLSAAKEKLAALVGRA